MAPSITEGNELPRIEDLPNPDIELDVVKINLCLCLRLVTLRTCGSQC